jgi:hypothetical protein
MIGFLDVFEAGDRVRFSQNTRALLSMRMTLLVENRGASELLYDRNCVPVMDNSE